MKTCPTCGNTFSRRVSFCFDDGTPLVGEPEAAAPQVRQAPATPAVPAPRRGRRMLARRRVAVQASPEHTEAAAGAAELTPAALKPLGVENKPRRKPAPPLPATPPAVAPREHVAPPTPTPVAAPVTAAPTAVDTDTPTPPRPAPRPVAEDTPPRIPRSASEAPTLIVDNPEEDEDEGGWGMMLTIVLGTGVVVLVGLAIAVGLMWSNQGNQDPALAVAAPAPVAEPAPTAALTPAPPAPVAAPEPVIDDAVEPVVDEVDPASDELVEPGVDEVPETSPEPVVAPEPVAAPDPEPAPRSTSDRVITVQPPSPSPTSSPWTSVEPAPAPAPAPVASAPLSVNSTPSGAAVRVNGVTLGATPFRMTMPGGDYPIELSLEGYESTSRTVSITDAGGAAVSVTLTPLARTGPILVTLGGWEGAELLVDGRLQGTLPARIDAIQEGSHTFTVRRNGVEQQFTRSVSLNGAGMTVVTLGG